ncbi:MAG: RNA methyltransferase [Erysipelotrichaceae bacterium]|nr:RNA methyltransferase [Erysipelotrichaceae bacterium]
MDIITSLNNGTIKEIAKLKQIKYRKKTGTFLAEGKHLYEEARCCGIVKQVLLRADSGLNVEEESVLYVSDEVMHKLSDTVSLLDIITVCRIPKAKEVSGNKVIMLDGVQDPGNIGTIIRTAISFGYRDIILGTSTVDIYNEKVVRSTQGALFEINAVRADLTRIIPELRQKGYHVYGTALQNGRPMREFVPVDKIVLVFGNEGNGVSDEVLALTEKNIFIEMETFESLNVGVAAGIAMYYFK